MLLHLFNTGIYKVPRHTVAQAAFDAIQDFDNLFDDDKQSGPVMKCLKDIYIVNIDTGTVEVMFKVFQNAVAQSNSNPSKSTGYIPSIAKYVPNFVQSLFSGAGNPR